VINWYRSIYPECKVIQWQGDVFRTKYDENLKEASKIIDLYCISYYGDYLEYKALYPDTKAFYFPFAYSEVFNREPAIIERDIRKYRCDLIFIGTYYPERGDILNYIAEQLPDLNIKIIGKAWQKCPHRRLKPFIQKTRSISLKETLKAYKCATLSLNIHHRDTKDGFNMRFYEICGVGGIQITEWQPALQLTRLADSVITFRTHEELIEKIKAALNDPEQCAHLSKIARDNCRLYESYNERAKSLLSACASSQVLPPSASEYAGRPT